MKSVRIGRLVVDRTHARFAAAGASVALLSGVLGTSSLLLMLSLYWMLGSTTIAFACGGPVRDLLDSPGMYPRSMQAIARAAEDPERPRVVRRTAAALYLYMGGMIFCGTAVYTIVLVSFVFFRL
jgi:hypothetical protein